MTNYREKTTVSTSVLGSIVIILVTFGLFINLGNSTFFHVFPALKSAPTTAYTSPDTSVLI